MTCNLCEETFRDLYTDPDLGELCEWCTKMVEDERTDK